MVLKNFKYFLSFKLKLSIVNITILIYYFLLIYSQIKMTEMSMLKGSCIFNLIHILLNKNC